MVSSKHAFWWALAFTVFIFIIGVILGFVLENSRSNDVEIALISSEISLLDQQVRTRGIEQFDISCEHAKSSTFEFADKIYEEASQLELFDSSAKFTSDLKLLHKRYDLLRVMLWMESIDLKNRCGNVHTLVYLFEYAPEETQQRAIQTSYSRMLLDLKNSHENEILLIPIAANLDIESVELIKEKYFIEELPAIIIDEKTVISGETSIQELEDKIFSETLLTEDSQTPDARFQN